MSTVLAAGSTIVDLPTDSRDDLTPRVSVPPLRNGGDTAGSTTTCVAAARAKDGGQDDGDILFIDEVHQMVAGGKAQAEWLLNFLQDGVISGPRGMEEMPRVTVLAATTDAGRLPETVLDRFRHCELKPYTEAEAVQIAAKMSERVLFEPLPLPSPQNCQAIARASNRNPRLMKHMLEQLRDLTLCGAGQPWTGTEYLLEETFSMLGVTEDGLTRQCQALLVTLLVDFGGEPAGRAALAERLQEPGGLEVAERILISKDYISRTSRGRALTRAGLDRARALLAHRSDSTTKTSTTW